MTPKRDYSQVTFPWEDDPNWDTPREGATSDPGDKENWRLQCGECALTIPLGYNVGTVGAHWQAHFPEWSEDHQEPAIQLNLVWVGLGTPPPGRPEAA
jgi:hypothetical protein